MVNAACPSILKTSYLSAIAPNNLVIAVAEKRRVKVNQINALALKRFKYFEVVSQD
jgi:hypothetical protein